MGELSRGKLYSLGNGRWMLNLAKNMEVRAIFTGYYGKGKPVSTQGSRKGAPCRPAPSYECSHHHVCP